MQSNALERSVRILVQNCLLSRDAFIFSITPHKKLKLDFQVMMQLVKVCRVKQRTKTHKRRKGFLGVRKDVVNIVHTGINSSNVYSESIKDNLVNNNVSSTILPKSENEQILNPQKLSASSRKV